MRKVFALLILSLLLAGCGLKQNKETPAPSPSPSSVIAPPTAMPSPSPTQLEPTANPTQPAAAPTASPEPPQPTAPPTQAPNLLGLSPQENFVLPAPAAPGTLPATATPLPQANTPLSPEQIQALGPLPVPAAAQEQNGALSVSAVQTVQADFNQDGQPETMIAYLGKVSGQSPDEINGSLGVAVFNLQGQLVWRSQPEALQGAAQVDVRLEPIGLQPGTQGIFYERKIRLAGAEGKVDGQASVFRWDGTTFQPAWQQTSASGASSGQEMNTSLELKDVDGFGGSEILPHVDLSYRRLTPPLGTNFHLFLPGAVGLQWTGDAYLPVFFANGDQLTPIHPQQPIVYAPRFSQAVALDATSTGWGQIEYWPVLDFRSQDPNVQSWMRFGWDDQALYLSATAPIGKAVTLALDTDLASDLPFNGLNSDDWVLTFQLAEDTCGGVQVGWVQPAQGPTIQSVAVPTRDAGICNLFVKIDLKDLGLSPAQLQPPQPGWVSGSTNPTEQREYHPAAGKVIGLAVLGTTVVLSPGFNPQDPTTWTSLVFMSDR